MLCGRRWIAMVLALLLIGWHGAALCAAHPPATAPDRPNVVVFLVDDLGWTDLGCFGSDFYETPHIDGLAASGMKFTQGYAACCVCSPTRAAMMTGRYPTRYGITDYINQAGANQPENWRRNTPLLPAPYADRLPHAEKTMAEYLKDAGYATFFAGKWHLGPEGFWPEDQGFGVNHGGIEHGGPYGGKRYFSPYGNLRLKDGPPGEHLPDRLASEAASFIKSHRDQPFVVYLSFYSVHTPLMARDDLRKKYEEKRQKLGREESTWGIEGERKVRLNQNHAVYAGMIEAMDLAVGKVLAQLEKSDVADKTLVIFTGDNGGLSTSEGHPTCNLPLRAGKGWNYEGGIREPTMIRYPGVTRPGSQCDIPICSVDYLPTALAITGVAQQADDPPLDGVDISPLLRGERPEAITDRALYWHYPHYGNQGGAPSGVIRQGDFKLIEWYGDGALELYNLAEDLGERNNLAKQMPKKAEEMRQRLAAWRNETGARMPSKRE